jgi:membrane fusion protein, heavy metal efflux system
MKQLIPFIILSVSLLLVGCSGGSDPEGHSHGEEGDYTHEQPAQQFQEEQGHSHEGEDSHSHEEDPQLEGAGVITQWTDKTELFMEYPELIVGQEATFAVHLTRLSDFKPISESEVKFVFSSERGNEGSVTETEAQIPGIYGPDIIFERAGRYDLTIIIQGMVDDTLQVDGIPVYSSAEDVPLAHEDEDPNLISFLKEQQWNIPFGTEAVGRQTLFQTVEAHGETQPVTQNESIVSAPFAGIVLSSMNRELPVSGQRVSKGHTLLRLNPAIQSEDGENYAEQFINAQSRLELAENNLRRSERLFTNEAIPEAELEQARMEYRQALIRYQTIHETLQIEQDAINGYGDDSESYRFELKAPIDGTIVDMFITPGMQVRAGEQLFRIADLSTIRLNVHLPAYLRNSLSTPESAVFSIQGSNKQISLEEVEGRLVSRGANVDPQTRTISLIYEINNEDHTLQTGLFTTVEIDTEQKESVLAVPESALIEEEGTYSVFVHRSGESFEKREVVTDIRNRGHVEIVSGLEEGERIVTVNAYRVKMASLSSEAPAHGHSH